MFPRTEVAEAERRRVPAWAIIGIFLILLFWFIAQARAFLMPVSLAMLLFFVFAPLKRIMGRWDLGEGLIAAILVAGMVALVAALGLMASGPISNAIDRAPQIGAKLEERFTQLRENFRGLEDAARKIDEISSGGTSTGETAPAPAAADPATSTTTTTSAASGATATTTITQAGDAPPDIKVEVHGATGGSSAKLAEQLASIGPALISQGIFTLILLYFMLAAGDLLYLKIVQSFDTMREKRTAYSALCEIESSLGQYMLSITIINAGLGICIGLAMWAWGMPSPLLFGLGAFVLNFIPYIGSMIGTAIAVLVALVVFPDLLSPVLIAATYLLLTSIEGQLVTPHFVSRRLQLNTVVVFLTVALWAWLWSVLGMVVAVPMLVVIRVLADHIPGLEKFGNFLSGDTATLDEQAEEEEKVEAEAKAKARAEAGAEAQG